MVKKVVFPSGLRLLSVPSKATRSVTVFVLVGVGSRFESADINGVSHFVEHLMFKGTKKRPTTLDISKELDSVGAEYNAGTAKDWTCYYVKIDTKNLELALDVLSDMIYNSKFDNKEIKRERGVIVEEINMVQDNPMMYVEDVFEQSIFADSALGAEISGPKEVIQTVPRQKIINYRDHFYRPENMVVSVAGNFDSNLTKLVTKYFQTKAETRKRAELKSFVPFSFDQKAPRVKIHYKKTEQIHLALGFPGVGYFDKRVYALNLLSIILGGNMSSRLFISVRERRGLAYFVRSYLNIYQDVGNFIIHSGLDQSRLEEAIRTIRSEISKVRRLGVSADELKKAKEYLRGKLTLTLEDSENVADWYAKQELLQNRTLSPEAKMKLFDRVTLTDIKAVARDIFRDELINLAVIGPFKDEKYFLNLLK